MLTQSQIDAHNRKRFYIVLPQVRNSVQPDTYVERFGFRRDRFSPLQKQLMALLFVAAMAFLLAFEFGLITPVLEFFFS